jgi:hypothetical protein
MSIYCSAFGFDEHKPRCAKMRKIGVKEYLLNDSKPCTCGISPILYQGSHVLPSDKDKRGGDIGFASIPPHITRNGKDNRTKEHLHPWLRFHLNDGFQDSLVLTRKQVIAMRDALNDWIERSTPQYTPKAKPTP